MEPNKEESRRKADFENNAIKIMARNLQSFGTLLTEELALLVNFRSASAIQLKGQSLRRMPDKSEMVLNSLVEDINLEKQLIEKKSPDKPFSGLSWQKMKSGISLEKTLNPQLPGMLYK